MSAVSVDGCCKKDEKLLAGGEEFLLKIKHVV